MAAAVLAELAADPAVRGSRVSVTARDGVVLLAGRAPDAGRVPAAGLAAWRVAGARDVCHGLRAEG
nr:BON domain-containing protein [Motilibacter aurantiacus]